MHAHAIAPVEELPPGASRIVEIGGRSIGVFNSNGSLYALRNVCPHHGAPLCLGAVGGRMVPTEPHTYGYGDEGKILHCPWHGYEFSLDDGHAVLKPETMRVRSYKVEVVDGDVVIYI
jgi:3-phenylpropionate/trans-cinnamate dioxygenase ferredoxin subunit